jgi:ABC-type sugar transport system ATPase subunit
MVFETYALYPTLSIYENLAFPLRSAGWNKEDVARRVKEIVDILQVGHLLNHKPRDLSSGQSQLVGLGRALMREPNVFVMDEPISHLDTRLRSRMRSYIKRLHIELGYTMIYVTHDQEEAMALADRIAIMDKGIIRQIGTPQEVFHHPNDLFVAGFVGEPPMNFLKSRVVHDNGSHHLEIQGHRVPIPAALNEKAQVQSLPDEITIGIRPFYIGLSKTADEQHTLPATVFVVEPLGDSIIISADTIDTRLLISLEETTAFRSGDAVWLAFDPDYMIGFDPVSEQALVRHNGVS